LCFRFYRDIQIDNSIRQTGRIVGRVKEEGPQGVVHQSRGRESNRKYPEEFKERVIELYRQNYEGFGPTLAQEKLFERDGISISDETLRVWLIGTGQWKKKRKGRQHRQWRPRKDRYGEMIQVDGSHHDWLEGRGPACVFMGYIDDATGKVYGRFYEYEGTIPAMDSFRRYIRKHGIPMSLYMDTHLEDTRQAKKIRLSKFLTFPFFMSCRSPLPIPFFL